MPSEETIELIKVNRNLGKKTDLPSTSPRGSAIAKLKELLVETGNIPILSMLYGSGGTDELLTLDAGEDNPFATVSDGTFLYVGTQTDPGIVVKISLSDFTVFDSLTLNTGENVVRKLITDGEYLYAVVRPSPLATSPGIVVRIRLSSFERIDAITFAAGDVAPTSVTLDGTFLYIGLRTFPGRIVKIDTRTFTYVSTLTLPVGQNHIRYLATDGQYVYGVTVDSPGIVFKIDISTFTETSFFALEAGEDSEALFVHGEIAYIGCYTSPIILVKVDLDTFSRVDAITLSTANQLTDNIFVDGTFIYVGSITIPGNVAIVDISRFEEVLSFVLPSGANFTGETFVDQTYLYVTLLTTPGQVFRKFIFPTNTDTNRRITHIDAAVNPYSTYILRPENSTGVSLTSGAGAYTKGVYTTIVAANAIVTRFYLHAVFLDDGAAMTNYEVDIATGGVGSESIIATVTHSMNGMEYMTMPCISIPSRTRISARCSDSTGSNTVLAKLRFRISQGG